MRDIWLIFLFIIAVLIIISYVKDYAAEGLIQTSNLFGSLIENLDLSSNSQINASEDQTANFQDQTNNSQNQSVNQKTTPKTATKTATVKPKNNTLNNPGISINTFITAGPKEGEVICETNQVTFEFSYRTFPENITDRVTFETKVEGLDDKWISTSSSKRTVSLTPGAQEYTFSARAKVKNVIDPTPATRTFKLNISPYFGKVKISSVRSQTSSSPSLITLRTYLEKEAEINITDWNIKGKAGSFVVPSGIEKYQPGYNPVPEGGIFVKQGDMIYLSGGANPLGRNRSFRPNKCMGYLANYYDFIISLPKNCPTPTKEEISHLDPCCQEFILRMRSCGIPDYSNSLRVSTDPECIFYLNNYFNYASCFYQHYKDDDFLRKNWYIYINKNIVVSNNCDTLYLRDENDLFVDKYSYGRPVCK